MFVHVVFFRFHDESAAPEAKRRLESMLGRVPTLRALEVGIDMLHTERSWQMTLRTEFDDQDGYNAYAVDAVHQEVLSWLKTVVQASATVDYVTQ